MQGAAQSDLRSLPSDEPWTVASQRDNDAEVVGGLRLGQTTFIDGGLRLGQTLNPNSREPMAAASANPGALRRQGFDFAEARPGGTGMASAFQKAALEDCESAMLVVIARVSALGLRAQNVGFQTRQHAIGPN